MDVLALRVLFSRIHAHARRVLCKMERRFGQFTRRERLRSRSLSELCCRSDALLEYPDQANQSENPKEKLWTFNGRCCYLVTIP